MKIKLFITLNVKQRKPMKLFNIFKRNKRGCTKHKTPEQRDDFYRSLRRFASTNIVFYEEQYDDLTEKEKREFGKFLRKEAERLDKLKDLRNRLNKMANENYRR